MYESAVESAQSFTRPIHSVLRNYGSTILVPINATLFFVNAEGWALTCGHVADNLLAEAALDARNIDFESELKNRPAKIQPGQWKKELERKYHLNKETTWEIRNAICDSVIGDSLQYKIIKHPKYDFALLKFNAPLSPTISRFPVFPINTSRAKIGKSLCRLGFPFPEFSNYSLDANTNKIAWNNTGNAASPFFASDGIITRFGADSGTICELELSSPGLKGQSGGPVFDKDGIIWGLQSSTIILDLDFDVKDYKVFRNGLERKIDVHSMLNLGRAIHINVIIEFMKTNNVSFQTCT